MSSDIAQRLAMLSPEKRALVLKKLRLQQPQAGPHPQPPLPPMRPVAPTHPIPLSFAQQRMWFLEQLEGESAAYHLAGALRLRGALQVEVLQRSLQAIVDRHAILRTTFPLHDGVPTQVIAAHQPVALTVRDLSDLPDTQQATVVHRITREVTQQRFDLAQGPLLRVLLLRLEAHTHVLLLTMHHIVADGWSLGILMRECAALYGAFARHLPSPLPALPLQYADFACWQRQWLTREALARPLAYWRQQLADAPPLLDLPTDRPRLAIQTFRGARQPVHINAAIRSTLTGLCRQSGCSPFMILLGAFAVLLSRYSRQNDLVIGSPIANRTHAETEPLIGCFVNTLALRIRLDDRLHGWELFQRVKGVALDAYAHQDVPFEQVVDSLQVERSLSRTTLFQVMFILHNTPREPIVLPGLSLEPLELETVSAKFDLTLTMAEQDGVLSGELTYNADLFDAETMRRLADHFTTLLAQLVTHPEWCLADLALLTPAEAARLAAWHQPVPALPRPQALHQLFEAQTARTPEAVAVVSAGRQLTYAELNHRANQLAHHLRHMGLGADMLVGLCVRRSLEMVVGLLGILKAGGAYVPLDPSFPGERLASMMAEAPLAALVTEQPLLAGLPTYRGPIVCLDSDRATIARYNPTNPAPAPRPEHLAYTIFTSGSTGKPKGVMVTHGNVSNFCAGMDEIVGGDTTNTFLAVTTLAFDISVLELLWTLTRGFRVIIQGETTSFFVPLPAPTPAGAPGVAARPGAVLDEGASLAAQMATYQVTHLQCTPSLLHMWLMDQPDLQSLHQLHTLLVGGEVFPAALGARLRTTIPAAIYNMYGPTETTIWSAIYALTQPLQTIPIGRPIRNTALHILDAYLNPVPIGVPGELYIGGDGVVRGYCQQPRLTAARFLPDPFSSRGGQRLYRTGDLARYRSDGNIEYLGRLDHQVKIRGFRIELPEIEVVLHQHPKVLDAVVVVRDDAADEPRLVGYVTLDEAGATSTVALHAYLQERLPNYMVPSQLILLDQFPLTPNGKIDRRALPAPERVAPPDAGIGPRNSSERRLTRIWEEMLQVRPISVRDNFFDLGGHSLLMFRVMAQIRQEFGSALPLTTLFTYPTIEQLAQYLAQHAAGSAWSPLVALQPAGIHPPLFCIHPSGGSVLCYQGLARHLGPAQPVYGLQSPGLERDQEPLQRIEDAAALFIAAIQTLQPHGPYRLSGWSLGGVIAWETAQQLRHKQHDVTLLALFDTSYPRAPALASTVTPAQLMDEMYTALGGAGASFQTLDAETQCARLLALAKHRSLLPPDAGPEALHKFIQVLQANYQAEARYQIQPYAGRVVYYLATDCDAPTQAHRLRAWQACALGGMDIYPLPCRHATLLEEPYVQALAAHLQHYLRDPATASGDRELARER